TDAAAICPPCFGISPGYRELPARSSSEDRGALAYSSLIQGLAMSADYRPTVFLPKTSFPMRGDLPKREPPILAGWEERDLCRRLREVSHEREKFILHDGPPYANGELHLGTALNKILKDVVNRSQQMLGKDAPYVPGWDCHGLPIEWIIEEKYRSK